MAKQKLYLRKTKSYLEGLKVDQPGVQERDDGVDVANLDGGKKLVNVAGVFVGRRSCRQRRLVAQEGDDVLVAAVAADFERAKTKPGGKLFNSKELQTLSSLNDIQVGIA